MKRVLVFSLVCLVIFLFVFVLSFVRIVEDEGMNATIGEGDIVFLVSQTPKEGDVVAIQDPLSPQKMTILRRIVALEGVVVSYDRNGTVSRDGKRISQQDMGNVAEHRVIEERVDVSSDTVKKWYLLRKLDPIVLTYEAVSVPNDHVFVLADRRDEALDSRYWGPVPIESIEGVVVLRVGQVDPWNGWWSWSP
jgi:signal peptidase I